MTATAPEPVFAPYVAAPRTKRLGVVAFVLGLAVFVLSCAASVFTGLQLGVVAGAANFIPAELERGELPAGNIAVGIVAIVQIVFGTAIGIWAIIQGIVAAASARGRAWGIVAIVLGVLAPGASLAAFFVAAALATSATN